MAIIENYQNYSGYDVKMFTFEQQFDHDSFLRWIVANWTVTFWYSTLYVLMVVGGRWYMEKRARFELRLPLIIWSGLLGAFSIAGAVRTIPELAYVIWHHGYAYSVCNPSYFYGPTAFWAYTFVISKAYELGDTVFIVLRKQPLIFLHWYHHISVMIYVWYSYTDHTAPGRWFMVMNYTVHSFMYSYYTFRAMQFRVAKWVSILITSLQISQMAMGLVVNISSYVIKTQGEYCQQSYENMRYCTMMYFSYFLLFSYFFYNAYIYPPKHGSSHPDKSITTNGVSKKDL